MKPIIIILATIISLSSCRKYLDEKPDISFAVPTSLDDFQHLMDYNTNVNDNRVPQVGDLGCDDYYLIESVFQTKSAKIRNSYVWASDIWGVESSSDWNSPYIAIYYSNVVLEGLSNFQVTTAQEQATKDQITGHALFVRAYMHYFLEETFGQPYKPATSSSDLGIPLRMTANLESVIKRSAVEDVYKQIIADLEQATTLLSNVTIAPTRPSKAAAFGFLARVYLTMQNYSKALTAATSSLQINNTLMDYNDPSVNKTVSNNNPFAAFVQPASFPEILYTITPVSYSMFRPSVTTTRIDSNLYRSYDVNDWRRTIYYNSITSSGITTQYVKADYMGANVLRFAGIATDEIYLIRAECKAREGNKDAALIDLNTLLIKRWKTGTFPFVTASDAEEALRKILIERRKELVFRSLRWIDLRRLNQDPRFAVTLERNLNGQIYKLLPNDKKYTYPIPNEEIQLSGIEQNPR